MSWQNIHIPRKVAEEVGKAATRSGVCRAQAIAAALWVFSRLSLMERATVIREYLYEHPPDHRGDEEVLTEKDVVASVRPSDQMG